MIHWFIGILIPEQGLTPLHEAVLQGHEEMLRFLISHRASTDALALKTDMAPYKKRFLT
jgi:ankyrin repeat protein